MADAYRLPSPLAIADIQEIAHFVNLVQAQDGFLSELLLKERINFAAEHNSFASAINANLQAVQM